MGAFWDLVRRSCPEAPGLTPPEDLAEDWAEHWLDPGLYASMTCGLPLRSRLRGKVQYVGTLDFGLGTPGHYRSEIIARAEEPLPEAPRLAFNSADSQSGWAAEGGPLVEAARARAVETGSHAASLEAVARGAADLAMIDCVTWRLLLAHAPNAHYVKVIGQTPETPGLPIISAVGRPLTELRHAFQTACAAAGPKLRSALGGLVGFVQLEEADYMDFALPAPPFGHKRLQNVTFSG